MFRQHFKFHPFQIRTQWDNHHRSFGFLLYLWPWMKTRSFKVKSDSKVQQWLPSNQIWNKNQLKSIWTKTNIETLGCSCEKNRLFSLKYDYQKCKCHQKLIKFLSTILNFWTTFLRICKTIKKRHSSLLTLWPSPEVNVTEWCKTDVTGFYHQGK